ncbi:hypothetical protein HanXRQr2_Chr14g0643811 [Helianthus annuus]|uniref:Hexosyltransferase n=2 Tax=Helianthus annuus TaxID=4232 RepID=A0A9K3H6P3_HELAN|nr:hypothetical protein HanXRQr2_Chr14g0643811 [Helianthus annuus]KAJ0485736.1 hypothetical protein HanHA89_Chr14g0571661 [Helianthus annuus]KAJ0656289.1 hypothetical protein HanLR1_Chr14g0534061 [Helianthus annuus]KAJ0840353.1 hypothetical protein HanPSC8_Chr14g0617691 [Helianthus annuus]
MKMMGGNRFSNEDVIAVILFLSLLFPGHEIHSLTFKLYIFRGDSIINLISSSMRVALENPFNYARKPRVISTPVVMVMDMVKWKGGKYRRRIKNWMELQRKKRIYELGSLPSFLLVFVGNIEPIDHRVRLDEWRPCPLDYLW